MAKKGSSVVLYQESQNIGFDEIYYEVQNGYNKFNLETIKKRTGSI